MQLIQIADLVQDEEYGRVEPGKDEESHTQISVDAELEEPQEPHRLEEPYRIEQEVEQEAKREDNRQDENQESKSVAGETRRKIWSLSSVMIT